MCCKSFEASVRRPHELDDDFYSNVIEDLELNNAGSMYPIMYKSRVMEIIYKYISTEMFYKFTM